MFSVQRHPIIGPEVFLCSLNCHPFLQPPHDARSRGDPQLHPRNTTVTQVQITAFSRWPRAHIFIPFHSPQDLSTAYYNLSVLSQEAWQSL